MRPEKTQGLLKVSTVSALTSTPSCVLSSGDHMAQPALVWQPCLKVTGGRSGTAQTELGGRTRRWQQPKARKLFKKTNKQTGKNIRAGKKKLIGKT